MKNNKLLFRIKIFSQSHKREISKEFTFDEFNSWKKDRLNTNVVYLKYKFKKISDNMWSVWNTEHSKFRNQPKQTCRFFASNRRVEITAENNLQRLSRNSNLFVKDDKVVSLSMTPSRKNKIDTYLKSNKPITLRERRILKDFFHLNTMSKRQLITYNDIFAKINRRTPLNSL